MDVFSSDDTTQKYYKIECFSTLKVIPFTVLLNIITSNSFISNIENSPSVTGNIDLNFNLFCDTLYSSVDGRQLELWR